MFMKIDKQNDNVAFSEESHTYWNTKTNDKYISVTTLIERFAAPFDRDFWSKYKGLEKLLGKEEFKLEKKTLLKTHRITKELLEAYGLTEEDLKKEQDAILSEWEKKNKDACEHGTKVHAQMEAFSKGGKFRERVAPYLKGVSKDYKCYTNPNSSELINNIEQGILPEYLVYRESPDGILKLAGQIDLLIKDGNDIYIIDYKSNKELKFKSGFDVSTKKNVTMKYPLNNLEDCNMTHYTLQLSTYAWMIQKLNPNFKIKGLTIIHFDHEGNVTPYQLDYLKSDVERMLAYYKAQRKKEINEEKRKKIEF